MPHLFTNRQRYHCPTSNNVSRKSQFLWESINAVVYLFGGLIFIAGSVLFLPKYADYGNIGVQIFIVGSLLYLLVTGHDFLETIHYWHRKTKVTFGDKLEAIAAFIYLIGTILFVLGSVFFLSQINLITAGSYCFIFGSILFFVGACINVMQITYAGSMLTLQLMNATGITFIVGSAIFVFGSVPYLWHFSKPDETVLFTLVGWEFIIGSTFFFLGGVFNFYRAYLAMRHYSTQS